MLTDLFGWTSTTELQALWRKFGDYGLLLIAISAWAEMITSVCATFSKRMVRLRMFAILNNMFGVLVGTTTGNLPTAIKHVVSLPLNAARMQEMNRLVANVRRAKETDLNLEWLKPFMQPRRVKAGRRLFSKGDQANEAYFLTEGSIELPELSVVLAPGALFGEMGLFTMEGTRTASAVCLTDARLLVISYEQFEQLYFQNPEFGLCLVRLIVRRFMMNQRQTNVAASSKITVVSRHGCPPGSPYKLLKMRKLAFAVPYTVADLDPLRALLNDRFESVQPSANGRVGEKLLSAHGDEAPKLKQKMRRLRTQRHRPHATAKTPTRTGAHASERLSRGPGECLGAKQTATLG